MDDKKYNLLDEPWICVMKENGEVKELSLMDVLLHAHQYRRLAGELPTQDVAVLRLLLAVLQTVVYRYDTDGNEDELVETEDAYERWKKFGMKENFRKNRFGNINQSGRNVFIYTIVTGHFTRYRRLQLEQKCKSSKVKW